ncbi:hypothetical protein EXIGLDRAFT_654787 [Exidia glandulosa HHB12029]|uniref:Uncharacterized protein n=1 Tax=Exidia glandulosa HHB12029 TaxID=1314781 RepID=A0A165DIX8_EXIGL|nr:hypothetical protein EXIGLDRAFT_654787 [Exidia glandulosa HHB12029]
MQLPYVLALLVLPFVSVAAVPQLASRTDTAQPVFPSSPPSCWICQPDYAKINSCALAATVFQNVSSVMLNPGRFITTIECACTDTFQSAYPQCADCFIQTNQTQFLGSNMEDVPDIVSGIRQICALASVILGHPVSANGEAVGQTPTVVPSPTGGVGRSTSVDLGPTAILGLIGALSVLAGIRVVWL